MRYALVSDIHANIQAWKVVYEDIRSNNVDRIICLGDAVGYGPNPRETLRELRGKVDAFVLGNHDAALCGKLDESLFNDDARLLLDWTKKQLTPEDLTFLGSFPLTLIGDGFLCAHGEFTEPGNFDYVTTAEEALPSWKANDSTLLIVGHTHKPALYVMGASGTPRTVEPQDFVVDPGKRYFVNIGSVGQPRGGDTRSCYCIYDSELRALYWRRTNFDVDAYRKSLKATGLTLDPSYYLPEPKSTDTATQKRRIVFTPPKSPDKAAHDVVAVQDLKTIPRRKQTMPPQIISALTLILVVAAVFTWKRIHPALDLDGAGVKVLAPGDKNALSIPKGIVEAGDPIAGWSLHLDDRYKQRAGVNLDPFGQPFCYMASKSAKMSAQITSPWISAKPGQNWELDISFQKKKDFSGHAAVSVVLAKQGKTGPEVIQQLFSQEPPATVPGDWARIRERFSIPGSGALIQLHVQGKFSGTILFKQASLKPTNEAPAPKPAATETPAPTTTPETAEKTDAGNDPWKTKVK